MSPDIAKCQVKSPQSALENQVVLHDTVLRGALVLCDLKNKGLT